MDERRFDDLSRRVGARARPRLPRRRLMGLLGGATMAGGLGVAVVAPQRATAATCKEEGQKCDKKKCKQQGKRCCCADLKCKNDRCEPEGGNCRTEVDLDFDWGQFGSEQGEFNDPFGITTDPDGNIYVTDSGNERVQIFRSNGEFEDEWGSQGFDNDEFQTPLGIGFGEDDGGADRVYVADLSQNSTARRFRRFRVSGVHEGNLGPSSLSQPTGVAVDSDGRIWVTDATMPGQVFLFDNDGDNIAAFSPSGIAELSNPRGIAVFEENGTTYVYVADTGEDRIVKFEYVNNNSNGLALRDEAGSTGNDSDEFNEPVGIAIDECGNLWVADRINNRIQQLDKDLNFESRFGSGLNRPTGVALSPSGKALYVVDSENARVVKYSLS